MAVFGTFGQNDTMRPSDILDLARKWYYLMEFPYFEYKNAMVATFWAKFLHFWLKIA